MTIDGTTMSLSQPAANTIKGTALLLRLEALAAVVFGVTAYAMLGQSWIVFAVLFLVPDVFMAGYLVSPRVGAWSYNLVHTYVTPALVAASGFVFGPIAFGIAAIWVAHIGMDRMLGYGLKKETGFQDTHLGRIGKK
ncbi:DUF4260 domain-containing protein [Devosia sp. BK]|uniref:DUF4260 domain-containing protein n=1 Tax=Devosia sp. BK TaxID=2871706 RepID=UPI00293BCFFE|nr:DUF4260 domain-containing protein [Devosia sp. BK]